MFAIQECVLVLLSEIQYQDCSISILAWKVIRKAHATTQYLFYRCELM